MLRAIAVFVLATTTIASAPKPWPDVGAAEPYAREVMTAFGAAELEQALAEKPEQVAVTLRTLGSAMLTIDTRLQARVSQYLIDLAAARARRGGNLREIVSFLVVDPVRFAGDREFRKRIVPLIRRGAIPAPLRSACLRELNTAFALEFDSAEEIAAAWELIPRRSSGRRVSLSADLRMPDDVSGPIETSIYSINSGFFGTAGDARAFLKAVRASAPKRRILVLADDAMAQSLKDLDVTIVPTFSRPYTPWPRDPFTVARTKDGGVLLVNRPNLQPEREEDANMVRALTQTIDAQWTVAPIPFHNGHILLTPDAAWISIHTVEIRVLQLLGVDRVPVQTFGTKAGVETYLAAVRKAAKELEELYRRPVRFVHPLEADVALMRKLGGGGGHDLDSIVTLLPLTKSALVGDFSGKPSPPGLQTFLDTVAAHLAKNGMTVRRLPLLKMSSKDAPKEYLMTWNNVVLEGRRAEGFASGIADADAHARKVFAASGYDLVLFPPLRKSVTHSGGYRCASNHIR